MTERHSGDVYVAEGHRLHTAPGSRRLRYGIMCRGPQLEAWQALVVRELQSIPEVEPALLIVDADAGAAGPRHRLWQRLRSPTLLWIGTGGCPSPSGKSPRATRLPGSRCSGSPMHSTAG